MLLLSVPSIPTGASGFNMNLIKDWTGAPGSRKRTWAENDFFKCFHSMGRVLSKGASPRSLN
jgi:hypothetical protein